MGDTKQKRHVVKGTNWTNEQYQAYIDRRQKSVAESQPVAVHEPLATDEAKACHPRRYKVCVVSLRVRLIDPDNLCAKYHVDGLRASGVQAIPDDSAKHINLTVSQEKVKTKAEECTLISIVPLP